MKHVGTRNLKWNVYNITSRIIRNTVITLRIRFNTFITQSKFVSLVSVRSRLSSIKCLCSYFNFSRSHEFIPNQSFKWKVTCIQSYGFSYQCNKKWLDVKANEFFAVEILSWSLIKTKHSSTEVRPLVFKQSYKLTIILDNLYMKCSEDLSRY